MSDNSENDVDSFTFSKYNECHQTKYPQNMQGEIQPKHSLMNPDFQLQKNQALIDDEDIDQGYLMAIDSFKCEENESYNDKGTAQG